MSVFWNTVASVVTGMAMIAAGVSSDLIMGKKPLPTIIKQLEQEGYGPFSEVDFDDGGWEMEVREQNHSYEIRVDPSSGKVLSKFRDHFDHLPPADAKPLSEILEQAVQAGYSEISEVDFKRHYWEIEARLENGTHEVRLDPHSGKVISDKLDD